MQGVLEDKKRKYHCYYELTLNIIGGKWEPIILYHISKHAIMSYGELINIPQEETVSVIIAMDTKRVTLKHVNEKTSLK